MSTLNVSNITDGTTTVGTSYVVNGSAKAWVNFNGTGTIAARDSFNVASLTDNGTGDYTVNFSSAFGAADYSVVGACSANFGIGSAYVTYATTGTTEAAPTASAVRVQVKQFNDANVDVKYCSIGNHGDLA